MELGADALWGQGFSARFAYTYLHAVVVQSYGTCVGLPCRPASVAAGNYIPAVPMNAVYAALAWRSAPLGFSATLETQGRAQIYADDRNTSAAAGYWIANLRLGWEQKTARWRFAEYASLNNLTDRAYVGSVIVNESNSRYFEPEPGRTVLIMFNAARRNE
jgi:iron complex outermembrane receptor protein